MKIKKIIVFLLLIIINKCATSNEKQMQIQQVSFAIIGNTHAESPFIPKSKEFGKLVNVINYENATFVIHLGNIIYAGYSAGLRDMDLERQFQEHNDLFSRFDKVCHFVPGDLDSFAGSYSLFEKYTGHNSYHSINYGRMIFIILNSADDKSGSISNIQLEWLKNELSLYDASQEIVIFSYHPLFAPKQNEGMVTLIKNSNEIHSILKKSNIKAFISGDGEMFYKYENEGIAYINAGCLPPYKQKITNNQFRYYMMLYKDGIVSIQGKDY